MNHTVDAVVLAGGKNSEAMRAATGVEVRALARLGNHTMLEYVIRALGQASCVGKIYVVGEVPESVSYQLVPPGDTLLDNLMQALHAALQGQSEPHSVLAVTSDIPFLTSEAVEDFVQRACATQAALCYPIIPLELCRTRFPQMQRTSLKIREGTFTGGNMMLLDSEVIMSHREAISNAYAARKSPLKLAGMLGWGLLLRVVLAQTVSPAFLTLPMLETGVSRLLKCHAVAVLTQYAEIGADIDKPEDIEAGKAILLP